LWLKIDEEELIGIATKRRSLFLSFFLSQRSAKRIDLRLSFRRTMHQLINLTINRRFIISGGL
jgi:hypothetical protein